jgi:AcrR family transcriptional regulator
MTDGELTRTERRRARTRQALVDATRSLVASSGVDAVTIARVAETADIGFGTFYGYFDSKEALVAAVFDETVGEVLARVLPDPGDPADSAEPGEAGDPAELVASGVRALLGLTDTDPVLLTFLLRVDRSPVLASGERSSPTHATPASDLVGLLGRHLERGVDTGRFAAVADRDVVGYLLAGAVDLALQARLAGRLDPDADERVAAGVLVLLGVPEPEAVRIAHGAPLPAPP